MRPRALRILIRAVLALGPCALVLVLAGWWASAMFAAIAAGDRRVTLSMLTIDMPAAGVPVTIGRAELAQPASAESAEIGHVRLVRDSSGTVTIANAANERKLEVGRAGDTTRDADRLILTPGRSVTLAAGKRNLEFSDVSAAESAGALTLTSTEDRVTTRYAITVRGRQVTVTRTAPTGAATFGDCPAEWYVSYRESAERWTADLFGAGAKEIIALVISSGTDACRIGRTVYVPFRPRESGGRPGAGGSAEFHLIWDSVRGQFALKLGRNAEFQRASIRVTEKEPAGQTVTREPLRGIAWPVAVCPQANDTARPEGLESFVAGRGRYAICAQPGGGRVEIRPEARVTHFAYETCREIMQGSDAVDQDDKRRRICPSSMPAGKPVARTLTAPANVFDASPIPRRSAQGRFRSESVPRLGVFAFAFALFVLFTVRAFAAVRHQASLWGIATAAPFLLLISTALAAYPELAAYLATPTSAGWIWLATIGNWALAGVVLAAVSRTGAIMALTWAMFTGLAAVGTVSLTTLAVDLGNTDALEFVHKHKLVFVDLLPLVAIALALLPERLLREAISRFLLGNRLAGGRQGLTGMLMPWMVHIAVVAGLFIWLVVGTQQGLFGFLQPIEFGKFWAIVLVAVILTIIERRARRIVTRNMWGVSAFSFVLLVVFIALLAVAPVVRSDYSPLIVVIAATSIVIAFRLSDLLRWIRLEGRHIDALHQLPRRFPPRIMYRLRILRPRWRIDRASFWAAASTVKVLGFLVLIAVALTTYKYALSRYVLHLEDGVWPSQRECRIEALVAARGKGRNVPIERFLTWDDLDYAMFERPAETECHVKADPKPTKSASQSQPAPPPQALAIRFPELSFQVARSRSEIAAAACQASDIMKGGGVKLGPFNPAAVVTVIGGFAAHLLGIGLNGGDLLCKPLADASAIGVGETRSNLLAIRGPATVPVARNDFAAAYLLGRHGVESGILLLVFQFGLIILSLFIYLRLQWSRPPDPGDAVVRYFVSLMAIGSAALFGVQWLFAWSNVLGLLPVMGQPMTWLSYATSHHLLMALPAALLLLQAARLSGSGRQSLPLRVPPRRH